MSPMPPASGGTAAGIPARPPRRVSIAPPYLTAPSPANRIDSMPSSDADHASSVASGDSEVAACSTAQSGAYSTANTSPRCASIHTAVATEDGGWRTEDGASRTEDGEWRTDDGG